MGFDQNLENPKWNLGPDKKGINGKFFPHVFKFVRLERRALRILELFKYY
jgi:hypothetical protein